MSSKQSCWEIYNKQMSEHNSGDALWYPTPLSYFKRIQLGDVGYIRRGRFNLLFSAGCSGERQLGTDVPRTFKHLDVGPIASSQRLPGHLSSSNIREIEARYPPSASTVPMLEPSSSISFRLAENQGAILLTKYSTYQQDVQLIGNFEKYTKDHYNSWVAFARETGHGDDVKPILVTGVDMTRDFAVMTCPNNDDQTIFKFTTSVTGVGSVWGTWHSKVPIYTNSGPHLSRTPSPTQTMVPMSPGVHHTDIAPDEYDQCVFIRYYTVRKRLGIPKVIKAGAGPHDLGPGGYGDEGSPLEEQSSFGSDSDIVSGLFDDDKGSGSSVTSIDSEPDTVVHNITPDERDDFDAIADYIFQNSDADSALIHHRDIALLREPRSGIDLDTQLIEKCPRVTVDENGVGKIGDDENPSANVQSHHPLDGIKRATRIMDQDTTVAAQGHERSGKADRLQDSTPVEVNFQQDYGPRVSVHNALDMFDGRPGPPEVAGQHYHFDMREYLSDWIWPVFPESSDMQRRSASINERSPQLSFSGYTSTLGDVLNEDPLTAMNRRASASIYFDNPAAYSYPLVDHSALTPIEQRTMRLGIPHSLHTGARQLHIQQLSTSSGPSSERIDVLSCVASPRLHSHSDDGVGHPAELPQNLYSSDRLSNQPTGVRDHSSSGGSNCSDNAPDQDRTRASGISAQSNPGPFTSGSMVTLDGLPEPYPRKRKRSSDEDEDEHIARNLPRQRGNATLENPASTQHTHVDIHGYGHHNPWALPDLRNSEPNYMERSGGSTSANECGPPLSFSGYIPTLGDVLNENPSTAIDGRASPGPPSTHVDYPEMYSQSTIVQNALTLRELLTERLSDTAPTPAKPSRERADMLSCAESSGLHSHGGGGVGHSVELPQNLRSDGLPNQPSGVHNDPRRSKSPTNAPDKNHTHAMESLFLPELGLLADPTTTRPIHAVSLSQTPDHDSVLHSLADNITRHALEGAQVRLPSDTCIPQRHHPLGAAISDGGGKVIMFATADGLSFPAALAAAGEIDSLVDKNDVVFTEQIHSIDMRIEWPGCEWWFTQIKTLNYRKEPSGITRSQLLREVAKQLDSFIRSRTSGFPTDRRHGKYRIGYGGIQLRHIRIASLEQVSHDLWQPRLVLPNGL